MRKDKMILGADVVVSTDCQETGLNNNVLICGSSGCGKQCPSSNRDFWKHTIPTRS